MKKTLLFALLASGILCVNAQKKVAYITFSKALTTTAVPAPTTVDNDPIIQMLKADANLNVTVKALTSVLATDVISDLTSYDVIVVQETFAGAAGMLTPAGALALRTIPKPFVYNKNYALQKTRALASASAGAGKEADGTLAGTLTINVESAALTNDLFKACSFVNTNQIKLFNALSTDGGDISVTTSVKAINYTTGLTAIPGTLLAQPSVLNAAAPVSVCINDVPAGTVIDGTETTVARGIFVGMNTGAICANGGKNITDDGLTIWRNAVYMLAGLAVPSTKASLPTGINDTKQQSDITFDGKVVRNLNNETINVYNVTGKLISNSNKDLDMSTFAKGIYLIKTRTSSLKVSLLK